jgi:hypothetical protein
LIKQNDQSSADRCYELLSEDIKPICYMASYFVKSNGFGFTLEKFEDDIWDQCKWTTDLLKLYISEVSKVEDKPDNKKNTKKK